MTLETIAATIATLKTANRGELARVMRQMAARALAARDYTRWLVLKTFAARTRKRQRK
jgi:hypothetical protein